MTTDAPAPTAILPGPDLPASDVAADSISARAPAEVFDALVDRMIAATPRTAMTIARALGRDRLDRIG